jgi:hypothetical protein
MMPEVAGQPNAPFGWDVKRFTTAAHNGRALGRPPMPRI